MAGIIKFKCGTCGSVVGDDGPPSETRIWAFEQLRGWGVQTPSKEEGKLPEFRNWNFEEHMQKAEELARWVHGIKKNDDLPA